MSSPKFELAKRNNPRLADLLDRLMAYIDRQTENGQNFFLPKLAAASLGLNDGEAYVLLETLAQSGVLRRVFNVYCGPSGELLTTVHSEDELNEVPHCDECDRDHDLRDLRLELAFELAPEDDRIRKAA
jgi:hypothetical protein